MNWLKRIAAILAGRPAVVRDDNAVTLRGLLDTAPDAMIVVDRQGRIVLVNAQAERMFGYDRADLLGQSMEILLPQSCRTRHTTQVADYMAAPRPRPMGEAAALRGRRRDGTEFPIEVSLGPFRAGSELLVSSAIRDITARRKTEAELDAARSRALATNRAKSEFLANMSHELRTPLNAVLGFGQLLQLDRDQTLTPKQFEHVGHHLLTLVNEVLDLSEVEAGRLRLSIEPAPVAEALADVGTTMQPMADRFNRWRKAGVWDRLMDAIVAAYDGDVQMIDSSIVRVHQHGATAKRGGQIDVWVVQEEASQPKSTRSSTAKGGRSSSS